MLETTKAAPRLQPQAEPSWNALPGARGSHSSHLHPVVFVIHVLQPGNELSRIETVSDRFVFVSLRMGQQRERLVLCCKQLRVSQAVFISPSWGTHSSELQCLQGGRMDITAASCSCSPFQGSASGGDAPMCTHSLFLLALQGACPCQPILHLSDSFS